MTKKKQEQQAEPQTAADLIQDEHNYRKHSDKNKQRIKKSIDECGFGRSVVVDADDVLVAGNGVQSVIPEDTPVRVIETDGTELVVVKRTDLHVGDEKRKKLALADNATSDQVEWDFDAIEADGWEASELSNWGISRSETDRLSELKFQSVYYEPQERPKLKLSDCIDTKVFDAKMQAINESDLDEDKKNLLRMFAYRFIRIDFQAVADYYFFNATDDEKKVIERLRLVLSDSAGGGLLGFIEDDILHIHESIEGWGGGG